MKIFAAIVLAVLVVPTNIYVYSENPGSAEKPPVIIGNDEIKTQLPEIDTLEDVLQIGLSFHQRKKIQEFEKLKVFVTKNAAKPCLLRGIFDASNCKCIGLFVQIFENRAAYQVHERLVPGTSQDPKWAKGVIAYLEINKRGFLAEAKCKEGTAIKDLLTTEKPKILVIK